MTPENSELSPLDEAGINAAVATALAAFNSATTLAELKVARLMHTGDKSPITLANRKMGKVPREDKASAGQRMGAARKAMNDALEARNVTLEAASEIEQLRTERVDVTVAQARTPRGSRHPLESLQERVADFFVGMGWEIAEGPEIEAEWFNFDALNLDADHPARQMQDTFFVAPVANSLVLRTHTSPVQARSLLERGAPVYIACPGKVYRTDELDATHTPVFHQVEGLAIDKGLNMTHLKGTLDAFAQAMFGPGAVTRLRPAFFPFTEPSAEMDFRCFNCPARDGLDATPAANCRTCGGTGWIEWGGCGMVDPNVLRAVGVDPEEYSGFAFGMGIERTLMLRNGVADMHDMVEGDVRFSQHYGTEL